MSDDVTAAEATTARAKVVEALKTFNWGNYSLDEVALGLADYPEYQQWVPALADHVLAELDPHPFHTIELREDGWTLKHPLDCRAQLFKCAYNRAALRLNGPPVGGTGIYRVDLGGSVLAIGDRVGDVELGEPEGDTT